MVMATQNAAQLFKAVQQNQELKERLEARKNPKAFVKMARKLGYKFTPKKLDTELNKLSSEELAAIINPGVAPRIHLIPR